jgi:putative ABC transport system permease protein
VILNETAARRFFPGEDPTGQLVRLGRPRRIVGVVKDSRDMRLDSPAEPTWYQPEFGHGTQLIVRTRGDAGVMVAAIRRELIASDPGVVIERIGPFADIVASTVVDRRMAMRLLATLACLAILVASLGLYGVLSFAVRQRMRELGVRSALGAGPVALLRGVMGDGLAMTLPGIVVGLVLSVATTRVLRGLLYEVSPTEPATILGITGLLILVSIAASLVPALRASRVDPAVTLRSE